MTWANAPAANPSVVGSLGAVSPGQTYEVDVFGLFTMSQTAFPALRDSGRRPVRA